jgi:hypothetical protein
MGHGLRLHEVVGASAGACTVSEGKPFLYCNPCLGIPLLLVPSPRCFFAVQLLVGMIALLVLAMFACRPVAALVGDLP